MIKPYNITPPIRDKVPILISVPHAGTSFPSEEIDKYEKGLINPPDDTDHDVDVLYNFAADMGITVITASYSRWLIDLNRSSDNTSLYSDGRIITALTPTTDFLGNRIYRNSESEPTAEEVENRKKLYYHPYYNKVTDILNGFRIDYGEAILWDAHSIRRSVPTIQAGPFPDLILGTNDGQSSEGKYVSAAQRGLSSDSYELSYNTPFKGGNITRHFGQPKDGIHALQLEMCKNLYMDDSEEKFHFARAEKMRSVLKKTFGLIVNEIKA